MKDSKSKAIKLKVSHGEPMRFSKSTSHISNKNGVSTTVRFRESGGEHKRMMKGLSSVGWQAHRSAKDRARGID